MHFRAVGLMFAVVGLFVMSFLLFYSPLEVNSIDKNYIHKLVVFSGNVAKERVTGEEHYFSVGDISVRCSCRNLYLDGKKVKIIGFVEEYQGKFYARALRIFVL